MTVSELIDTLLDAEPDMEVLFCNDNNASGEMVKLSSVDVVHTIGTPEGRVYVLLSCSASFNDLTNTDGTNN